MAKSPHKKTGEKFDGIRQVFGIPIARSLDLAQPMRLDVSRIGSPDEGLRLTLSIDSPHEFSAEVKLSRADVEWLLGRLQAELADPRNANMPAGSKE